VCASEIEKKFPLAGYKKLDTHIARDRQAKKKAKKEEKRAKKEGKKRKREEGDGQHAGGTTSPSSSSPSPGAEAERPEPRRRDRVPLEGPGRRHSTPEVSVPLEEPRRRRHDSPDVVRDRETVRGKGVETSDQRYSERRPQRPSDDEPGMGHHMGKEGGRRDPSRRGPPSRDAAAIPHSRGHRAVEGEGRGGGETGGYERRSGHRSGGAEEGRRQSRSRERERGPREAGRGGRRRGSPGSPSLKRRQERSPDEAPAQRRRHDSPDSG
jgi:hypothetical protein